jgi:tetratricopeptide (TPR) repeat protein/tRNA A-37 threonylcarbamoyl transferase component Bud32
MALDPERWARIQDIFHRLVDVPSAERAARLDAACGDDAALRAEILDLFEADVDADSVLDRDVEAVSERLRGAAPGEAAEPEVGPYRIMAPLGEGGMGVVYLARRDDVGQTVAIKVLRHHWLSRPARDRFAREQRALARLSHPSIASLYDADTLADGTPWFAMEYVDGVSLTRYCAQRNCPLTERLALFRQVCEAVQHAHQHLIVHRDLKPSNILVTNEGAIKLLDFGIAKPLDDTDAVADRTQTVFRMMTPNYAAPEQLLGGPIGTHTDIYALGVILYELLAGTPPYDVSGMTPHERDRIVLEDEPARPSLAARETGGEHLASRAAWKDLDVLCLTALQKDPFARYRTVEALIQDLDRFARGEPLAVRPAAFTYRSAKFIRRHARALAAVVLVTAGAATVVTFYTLRLRSARNAAMAESARTARIQEFTLSLFDGGDPEVAPPDDLRAVALLERGVREADGLAHEPVTQAALYHTLGSVYQRLGSYDRADALLTAAVTARRRLLGAAHPDTLESAIAQGLLRIDQAKLDDADRLVRDALDVATRALPADHRVLVKAIAAAGKVLEERGAYDQAIPMLERAAQTHSAGGTETRELAATLTALANTHFYAGHLDESEALNRRVLDMDKRLRGPDHPNVADDLLNLGAIASNRERYADAVDYYRQAFAIMERWHGADHPQTASAMAILAQGLAYQGEYDESAALLRRALTIQERVYGPAHRRVGFVLNELGSVALRRKDLSEAETAFRRSLEVNRQVYSANHFRVGVALSNLASVYLEQGAHARAERTFQEALQVYAESLPPEHTNIAVTRIKLGRALIGQQRFEDAERQLIPAHDSLRSQKNPPESWLRAAREDLVRVYDALRRPDRAAVLRAELAPQP